MSPRENLLKGCQELSLNSEADIWLVYDGECPICRFGARSWTPKDLTDNGINLHLLDAREDVEHALIKTIDKLGFELDRGIIIYNGQEFFQGERALMYMASASDNVGWFSRAIKFLFEEQEIVRAVYPWLRRLRNLLLRVNGVAMINNLNEEPIFKNVFGKDWDALPKCMKKHYSNRPYSLDTISVEGVLDIYCGGPIRKFPFLYWLLGSVPPVNEKNVPVHVDFKSSKNSNAFYLNRIFSLTKRRTHLFNSRMARVDEKYLVEIMRFGIGWKMEYSWTGEKVKISHVGYVLNVFGVFIPFPIAALAGKVYAEEIAVDENTFDMKVSVLHPWWGKLYEYSGKFYFVDRKSVSSDGCTA